MERPNIEIVRQAYEAFRLRDVPKVFSLLAPDVEFIQSSELPWGGTFTGHAGAGEFFGRLTRAVHSTVDVERFIEAENHVIAIGRTHGTVIATGRPFDVPVAHDWEIKDRKVGRIRFFIDNPTMLAALTVR